MSTNKHATIRYQALDRCFSNNGKRYFIDDLVDKCNDALYEYTGTSEGVKKRVVYDDINFMLSEQGWSIPLERLRDGKKVYFRYSDPNFSISKQALNENEVDQLKETISILSRFKGIAQFDWMEDLIVKMETVYKVKSDSNALVSFEQNPYLKGLGHFAKLFNALQYNKVIKVVYKGYKQKEPVKMIIHPYHLKQYNNRWFLFGLNGELNVISNLALDRIIEFSETTLEFKPTEINFDDFFEDVIGVTVKNDLEPKNVLLEFTKERWDYIKSKPIHGSQKVIRREGNTVVIQLEVQINKELSNIILGFGADVKLLEPTELVETIKSKIKLMNEKYN
jgi:predicted DNA-binding transcriptional regulator YafY